VEGASHNNVEQFLQRDYVAALRAFLITLHYPRSNSFASFNAAVQNSIHGQNSTLSFDLYASPVRVSKVGKKSKRNTEDSISRKNRGKRENLTSEANAIVNDFPGSISQFVQTPNDDRKSTAASWELGEGGGSLFSDISTPVGQYLYRRSEKKVALASLAPSAVTSGTRSCRSRSTIPMDAKEIKAHGENHRGITECTPPNVSLGPENSNTSPEEIETKQALKDAKNSLGSLRCIVVEGKEEVCTPTPSTKSEEKTTGNIIRSSVDNEGRVTGKIIRSKVGKKKLELDITSPDTDKVLSPKSTREASNEKIGVIEMKPDSSVDKEEPAGEGIVEGSKEGIPQRFIAAVEKNSIARKDSRMTTDIETTESTFSDSTPATAPYLRNIQFKTEGIVDGLGDKEKSSSQSCKKGKHQSQNHDRLPIQCGIQKNLFRRHKFRAHRSQLFKSQPLQGLIECPSTSSLSNYGFAAASTTAENTPASEFSSGPSSGSGTQTKDTICLNEP